MASRTAFRPINDGSLHATKSERVIARRKPTLGSPDNNGQDLLQVVAAIVSNSHGRDATRCLHKEDLEAVLLKLESRLPPVVLLALVMSSGRLQRSSCRSTLCSWLQHSTTIVCQTSKSSGSLLQPAHARLGWFYSEQYPPRQGRLYYKKCTACNTVHDFSTVHDLERL